VKIGGPASPAPWMTVVGVVGKRIVRIRWVSMRR
jgi:hypothetical protein